LLLLSLVFFTRATHSTALSLLRQRLCPSVRRTPSICHTRYCV